VSIHNNREDYANGLRVGEMEGVYDDMLPQEMDDVMLCATCAIYLLHMTYCTEQYFTVLFCTLLYYSVHY
jgi:hypothetical protein